MKAILNTIIDVLVVIMLAGGVTACWLIIYDLIKDRTK